MGIEMPFRRLGVRRSSLASQLDRYSLDNRAADAAFERDDRLTFACTEERRQNGNKRNCRLAAYVRTVRVESVSMGDNQVLQNLQENSLASGVLLKAENELVKDS